MLRVPGLARPSWLLTTTLELVRAFRSFRPDVVLAYGLSNAFVARLLAGAYRVPFVFHIFDSLHALAEPAFLAPIARLVESAVLRSARAVILVHRGMRPYLREMHVPRGKVRFIMNGFEAREVEPERAAAVRRRLGVGDDEVLMVFVGWLYDHSGLREVATQLTESDRYAGYRLVVAGDGDLLGELRNIARRPGGGERLIVLGKVPVTEIPELIGAADVGLFASRLSPAMRNVVPAKVDEYLELGRPVVATAMPGMLAELRDVESMVWVAGPEEALEALAARLAGKPDPRAYLHALGTKARAYGNRRESWATVTERFRAVLEEARGEL